jgi:hypothetical protein
VRHKELAEARGESRFYLSEPFEPGGYFGGTVIRKARFFRFKADVFKGLLREISQSYAAEIELSVGGLQGRPGGATVANRHE